MRLEINKPSVWIPIALTVIGMVGAGVVGAYHEFVTVARHERDFQLHQAELAGISINQQAIGTRQNIKWLEQDLRDFYKRFGKPPYDDPDVQADYEKLVRDLKDERQLYQELQKQLKK